MQFETACCAANRTPGAAAATGQWTSCYVVYRSLEPLIVLFCACRAWTAIEFATAGRRLSWTPEP